MGDYWRDVKAHFKGKQDTYEKRIAVELATLRERAEKVGNHHRIGVWDFWHTGTVMNIKTGERISVQKLLQLTNSERCNNPH